MRFIQLYKNNIQTNICKNRYDKEIYYFSSINMSECSHCGVHVPILVVLGFCPPQCCSTQYRNMRYLMVYFPIVSGSSKVLWCLERRAFALWFGNLFKSQTEYKDLCHTYTRKRGIHSLFVRRRSNFHARLVYWFILRASTERTRGHVSGLVNFPEITVRPHCCVCLKKMIMIIKSSCLHEKDRFQSFE